MLAGTFLQGPATRHAGVVQLQQSMNTSTLFTNMTAAQKQKALDNAKKPSPWAYVGAVIAIFFAVFFNTIFMLIGNAVGRGQADFKRLWCGSMNIAVPTLGLGAIVLGIITTLRSPDSFSNSIEIARAMPSLGTVFSGGSLAMTAFLSGISIFTLWGAFLNATMLQKMAKTGAGVAWTFAIIVMLLGAAVAAGFAGFAHNMGLA
jgi:small basic protein